MPYNVLVVDDANEYADLIVLDLISRGFDASARYMGYSAIKAAFDGQFDLILLDIMMPGDITLSELLKINDIDYDKTLIPLTDDVFFTEGHSNVPLMDIIDANIMNVQNILLKDKSQNISLFQPLSIIERLQNILINIGDLNIHLDGYLTSSIIKTTLLESQHNCPKILFFTAGGVDDAFYHKYKGFFADAIFLKSNYYDKVLKELDYYSKAKSR